MNKAKLGSVLNAIKASVERTGSTRSKFYFTKSGTKSRIRFLSDMDDGKVVIFHDRWEPQLNVPCKKNFDEDANCPYCEDQTLRTREMYAWLVWDYDSNDTKIFMFAANHCSPIPALVAMYENYGTLTDRDYTVIRTGQGTTTSYSLVPMDKSIFRNKTEKLTDKMFLKIVREAYPDEGSEDKNDWDEPEQSEEEQSEPYEDLTAKQCFDECVKRSIDVKPRMEKQHYVTKLLTNDLEKGGEDDDFWNIND